MRRGRVDRLEAAARARRDEAATAEHLPLRRIERREPGPPPGCEQRTQIPETAADEDAVGLLLVSLVARGHLQLCHLLPQVSIGGAEGADLHFAILARVAAELTRRGDQADGLFKCVAARLELRACEAGRAIAAVPGEGAMANLRMRCKLSREQPLPASAVARVGRVVE